MWRRALLGSLALGALLAVCLMPTDSVQAQATQTRPNVIVILVDDLGWGDLGCYGQEVFLTPNIDKLAKRGVRLTRFYANTPEGAGSRVALQTGRYPFRTGLVKTPSPDAGQDTLGLPSSELTLGTLFAKAGYRTACVGKWQLGSLSDFPPRRYGYQYYYGIPFSNDSHPVHVYENDTLKQTIVFQPKLCETYHERLTNFIANNHREPFFLYYAPALMHKPLAASPAFYKKVPGELYGAALGEFDHYLGLLMKQLKDLQIDDRTLIVLASDNGPWYGGSTGGLRGMKGQAWEGGVRVPAIISWPGHIPEDKVSDQPAMMADLFSTVLAAANIPLPSDRIIDGKNLLPMLTEGAPTPHEAIAIFHEDKLCAIVGGRYKLHGPESGPRAYRIMSPYESYNDPKRPDGVRVIAQRDQYHPSKFPGVATGFSDEGFALVDLEEDPSEQKNLIQTHVAIAAKLQELFDAFQAEISGSPPGDSESPPAEDAKDATPAESSPPNAVATPDESSTPSESIAPGEDVKTDESNKADKDNG